MDGGEPDGFKESSFRSTGSPMAAASWLGSSILSSLLAKSPRRSTSARVTEAYLARESLMQLLTGGIGFYLDRPERMSFRYHDVFCLLPLRALPTNISNNPERGSSQRGTGGALCIQFLHQEELLHPFGVGMLTTHGDRVSYAEIVGNGALYRKDTGLDCGYFPHNHIRVVVLIHLK